MEQIKINFNDVTLDAICLMWDNVLMVLPQTKEESKNKSIAIHVIKKLRKKQIERTGKTGLFKISFEIHEAIVFEELLRPEVEKTNFLYQKILVGKVLDVINQKTA
jgi:hypothetical protein